ncbi:MAG: 2-oxo-4-hydroxy-4-carboxy-5-ureidoimidazoline decarboxylase, partial [Ktedonobacterales bacterium]
MTIEDINTLDRSQFVARLGALFEGPPWIVEQAWGQRPFAGEAALHGALCAIMYAAPRGAQLALLRAHPD